MRIGNHSPMHRLLTLLLLASGCPPSAPQIDRIDLWLPGGEVRIDAQGKGWFREVAPGREGRFILTPPQRAELIASLEPLRRSKDAFPESDLPKRMLAPCTGHYVTDQGSVNIHWTGPALDRWAMVDLGCEPANHADRNARLRAALRSLPVREQLLP